jgi:peptidoglycan/LPS O-acetylase OafA/YrhL
VKVNDRSEVLDAVRGIAIAFVVGRHYLPQYNTFGAMGVDLFFVLSGYLIGGILIDNRDAPIFSRHSTGAAPSAFCQPLILIEERK